MSGPVLAFRNAKAARRRPSRRQLPAAARKLAALASVDPAVSAVMERLIDKFLVDHGIDPTKAEA